MKSLFLIMSLMLSNHVLADEFADLKTKKLETIAKDPFANRKFYCESTTESGLKLTEKWNFFKTEPTAFVREMGGIVKKGNYSVEDGVLKVKETGSKVGLKELPSDKEWYYKYKVTSKGFDYIHEANGKKFLYECIISGSTVK